MPRAVPESRYPQGDAELERVLVRFGPPVAKLLDLSDQDLGRLVRLYLEEEHSGLTWDGFTFGELEGVEALLEDMCRALDAGALD